MSITMVLQDILLLDSDRQPSYIRVDAGSSEYRNDGHVPYNNRHNNIHATFWRVGGVAKRQS